jgi:hypothetical protein
MLAVVPALLEGLGDISRQTQRILIQITYVVELHLESDTVPALSSSVAGSK